MYRETALCFWCVLGTWSFVRWSRASPPVSSTGAVGIRLTLEAGSHRHRVHEHAYVCCLFYTSPRTPWRISLNGSICFDWRTLANDGREGDKTSRALFVFVTVLLFVFCRTGGRTGPEGSDGGRRKGKSVLSADGGACRKIGGCWGGSVFQAFRTGRKHPRSRYARFDKGSFFVRQR